MQSGLIRVHTASKICIFNGVQNKELLNSDIFDKLKDKDIETLVINNVGKNALFYYANKAMFPTVKKVIYLGPYYGQCVNGLFNFDEVFITSRFGTHHVGPQFKLLTDEMKDKYESLINKPIVEENTETYKIELIELKEIKPIFEVLE
jgi:hypothetical protein